MYCTMVKLIIIISIFLMTPVCVSDLGIEIDSYLKYDAHMNDIVGTAYSRAFSSNVLQLDIFQS